MNKSVSIAKPRRDWTQEQLLAVFRLYCHTPFGKLHGRNPEIISLSSRIGRTPGAVAMKACNFASLDPTQRARNISALGNTSIADRELWAQFEAHPEETALLCEQAYAHYMAAAMQSPPEHEIDFPTGPTDVQRLVRVRRVQAFFRQTVLASYDNRCAISGIRVAELLNASHIIPWSADVERRADPRNGIALNALYDRAFDRGFITFDESFRVVVSSRLQSRQPSELMRSCFHDIAGRKMEFPQRFAPDPTCMAYHRENVFDQWIS